MMTDNGYLQNMHNRILSFLEDNCIVFNVVLLLIGLKSTHFMVSFAWNVYLGTETITSVNLSFCGINMLMVIPFILQICAVDLRNHPRLNMFLLVLYFTVGETLRW